MSDHENEEVSSVSKEVSYNNERVKKQKEQLDKIQYLKNEEIVKNLHLSPYKEFIKQSEKALEAQMKSYNGFTSRSDLLLRLIIPYLVLLIGYFVANWNSNEEEKQALLFGTFIAFTLAVLSLVYIIKTYLIKIFAGVGYTPDQMIKGSFNRVNTKLNESEIGKAWEEEYYKWIILQDQGKYNRNLETLKKIRDSFMWAVKFFISSPIVGFVFIFLFLLINKCGCLIL